jgi:hypothetical protein
MASTLILKDKLDRPQVFMSRSGDECLLIPLDKVLEAGHAIASSSHDVVLLPSTLLHRGPLVVDHLSHVSPGDVVSFHSISGGRIQSRSYVITEEGKKTIKLVREQSGLVIG